MATYLNCVLLGAQGVGKTALVNALSTRRASSGVSEVCVSDKNSRHQFVFRLQEATAESPNAADCICVLFDVCREQTFSEAQEKIIPPLLRRISHTSLPCLLLIGTHTDESPRQISFHSAQDLAINSCFLYLEVSVPLRQHFDLLLRVLRIRANLKQREVARKTLEVACDEEHIEERLKENPTPQFSEKKRRTRYSFGQEAELEEDGVVAMQEKAEERQADPSTNETAGNLSFANMSNISSDEELSSSRNSLSPFPEYHARSSIPSRSGAETERQTTADDAQSGSVTERFSDRGIVLSVEVQLGDEGAVTVPVYESDSAIEVARRCLGRVHEDLVEELAQRIQEKVEKYCQDLQVRMDEEPEQPSRKVLFRVRVNMHDRKGAIIVREGDDLLSLAASFAEEHSLSPSQTAEVSALLATAYDQYLSTLRPNVQ